MKAARWAASLMLAGAVATGCTGEDIPPLTPAPDIAGALGAHDAAAFRYRCSEFPFDAAILMQDGTDEQAATPDATALRKYLATPPSKADGLPETGWHLIGQGANVVEFVTRVLVNDDSIVHSVVVEDGWRVSARPGCKPELILAAGVGLGTWSLDPDAPQAGPASRVLHLLVQEHSCASGHGPIGRIVGPMILPAGNQVYVLFGVRPLEGASTCQSVPPGRVTIDLGEPVGERLLVDPSFWPPFILDVG